MVTQHWYFFLTTATVAVFAGRVEQADFVEVTAGTDFGATDLIGFGVWGSGMGGTSFFAGDFRSGLSAFFRRKSEILVSGEPSVTSAVSRLVSWAPVLLTLVKMKSGSLRLSLSSGRNDLSGSLLMAISLTLTLNALTNNKTSFNWYLLFSSQNYRKIYTEPSAFIGLCGLGNWSKGNNSSFEQK